MAKQPKEKKEKKPKVKKIPFIDSIDADQITSEADLATFDPKLHSRPRKKDWADEADYMIWQSRQVEVQAAKLAKKAVCLVEEAEVLRQYGDPATRQKVKRAAKIKQQLADLEEQLSAEGINL